MLFILCIIFALGQANDNIFDNFDEELSDEQLMRIEDRLTAQKVRCTRRFTPGVCLESVISVWTFDFQILNCTERLGCAASHRTNRFSTYKKCMNHCQAMVDLYMQILAHEADGRNDSFILTEVPDIKGRREGSDSDHLISSPPKYEEYTDEYSGDEAINAQFMYGQREVDDFTVGW